METMYFLLFFVSTVIVSLMLGYFIYTPAKAAYRATDLSNRCGLAIVGAIAFGWTLLEFASTPADWPNDVYSFNIFPFLLAAVGLSLYFIEKAPINRFWIFLFITLISVNFFEPRMLVFQGVLPIIVDRVVTAILWAFFIHIYTTMDKINGMTVAQTLALCVPFSLLVLYPYFMPVWASFYVLIIIAALIGYLIYKKHFPQIRMGKCGSAPLGYLMGVFLIIIAAKGYWLPVIIMPAYYYFEMIYSAVYRFLTRKKPEPLIFSFYISHMIRKNLNAVGVFSFLMMMMLLLAFIGFLAGNNVCFAIVGLAIVFLYANMRLSTWGQPKVGIKAVVMDIKNASVAAVNATKDEIDQLRKK